MSKKSEQKGDTKKEISSIPVEDFDIEKYSLQHVDDTYQTKGQMMAFPRYDYGNPKKGDKFSDGDQFIVITKEIKITKGGIPKVDGEYRKTENDCLYFWLPLDGEDSKPLRECLEELDKYNDERINKKKNDGFVIKVDKSGKAQSLKNLKYIKSVKMSRSGSNDEEDDEDGEDDENNEKSKKKVKNNKGGDDKKKTESYLRIKIRFATIFEKDVDKDTDKKIKTRVYINDTDGVPKEEPEPVKSMEQLRKLFLWNCTAQFALHISKLWIMKAPDDDGVRKCGLGIKCVQMYISEMPEINKSAAVLGMSVFGIKPKQLTQKKKVDDADENKDKEDVDENKDDDEDNKPAKKTSTKKKNASSDDELDSDKKDKKKESDDDDESAKSSENDSEKSDSDSKKKNSEPAPKATKKDTKKKPVSDDDDDEDAEKNPSSDDDKKKSAKKVEKPKGKSKGKN